MKAEFLVTSGARRDASAQESLWTLLVWLSIVVGAVLRVYRLDSQSLWIDETFQYYIASAPSLWGVVDRLLHPFVSAHPPLSYVLNHLFLQAGSSDLWLRLPSALLGIGSLVVYYSLACTVLPKSTLPWVILVFAVSPLQIWYSQEARAYIHILFLHLLSTVLLWQACEQPRWWRWGLYVIVVAAGLYMHVVMAFGVLAHALWMLMYHRRRLRSYSVSLALAVCLFFPWWLFHALASPARMQRPDAMTGASWGALPYTVFSYAVGFSLGPSVRELHEEHSLQFVLQFLPVIGGVGLLYALLLATGLWEAWKSWGRPALMLCLLGLCMPLFGALVPSLISWPLFTVRYTISASPYFCLFIGTGLACGYRKNALIGMVGGLAVLGVSAWSLHNYFTNPRYAREDIRAAVSVWQRSTHATFLFSNQPLAVQRYLEGNAAPRYRSLATVSDITVQTRQAFATRTAMWVHVILIRDWHQQYEQALRQEFPLHEEYVAPGVKLFRIDRPAP